MTALDYDMTMRYMWYLGFPGSSIESGSIAREIHLKWPRSVNHLGKAISLTRRRSAVKRAKSLLDRQIIRCFVFGRKRKERQVMLKHLTASFKKSSPNFTMKGRERVLNAQGGTDMEAGDLLYDDEDDLDHLDDEHDFPGRSSNTSLSDDVRTVREVSAIKWFRTSEYKGNGRALMMTDIGSEVPQKVTNGGNGGRVSTSTGNSAKDMYNDPMDPCDVACLVYSATDHNAPSYLANLQKHIPDHIPCVYVALQENERYNENVFDLISKLCDAYELNHPQPIPLDILDASDDGEDNTLDIFFNDILNCGLHPEKHGKRPISREKREEIERRAMYLKGGIAIVTSVLLIGLSYFAYSSGFFGEKRDSVETTKGRDNKMKD